jgi:hypothetical protein
MYFLAIVFFDRRLANGPILAIAIGMITIGSFVFNSRYFQNRHVFKRIVMTFGPTRLIHSFLGLIMMLLFFAGYLLIIRYLDLFVESNP